MLNVLFVLYHDFTANGAVHVFHWANELSAQGVSTMVAVPDNPGSISVLGRAKFDVREFADLRNGMIFPDGRGPDIVHAWTPREKVRRFCQELRAQYSFRQFIHLEDNEWHLLAKALGRPHKAIVSMPSTALDLLVTGELSHPIHAKEFLRSADGVTVIMDRLRELVPLDVPTAELWPSADTSFCDRPLNWYMRSKLGVSPGSIVLAYTGNVHFANASEVRSLYLAVAILNREGHPTVLLRAGRDFYPFLGPDEAWGRANSIELGYLSHREIPELLAAADILVQPGKPDAFNDYRFPSKLPEFLAVGRPVILPASNIGLRMVHGVDAFVLPKADALGIAEAVLRIHTNRDLYNRLSAGSKAFFDRNLSWEKSGSSLLAFYQSAPAQSNAIYSLQRA